ncbi:MAG: hypothetical protein LBQ57_02145 [Spirochaetales bacterium]|nr:hypothetical protein [Spirochaetales bacterium]
MVKKICGILFCLCIGVSAFAQARPKQVLAKADIDNFIKNFDAIQEVLDAHEEELSSLVKELNLAEGSELTAALAKIRGFSVSAALKSGLAQLGMGNNGFEKVMVILYGIATVILDQMFQAMGSEEPEVTAMIEEQVRPMKAAIHASDLSLLSSRAQELVPLMDM